MKIKFLSIVLVFCALCLSSCSNEDEVFSCNPEANAWAKENLSDIRKMTRSEWLNLDESVQKAAFTAFSSEQKHNLWKQKIEEVLNLDWNEKERAHIEQLYHFLIENDDLYDREEVTKEFEIFEYKWIEYAKEELSWEHNLIVNMAMNANSIADTRGSFITSQTNSIRLKTASENESQNLTDCTCQTGSSDNCLKGGGITQICKAKNKQGKDHCKSKKCGLFWLSTCNGLCVNDR